MSIYIVKASKLAALAGLNPYESQEQAFLDLKNSRKGQRWREEGRRFDFGEQDAQERAALSERCHVGGHDEAAKRLKMDEQELIRSKQHLETCTTQLRNTQLQLTTIAKEIQSVEKEQMQSTHALDELKRTEEVACVVAKKATEERKLQEQSGDKAMIQKAQQEEHIRMKEAETLAMQRSNQQTQILERKKHIQTQQHIQHQKTIQYKREERNHQESERSHDQASRRSCEGIREAIETIAQKAVQSESAQEYINETKQVKAGLGTQAQQAVHHVVNTHRGIRGETDVLSLYEKHANVRVTERNVETQHRTLANLRTSNGERLHLCGRVDGLLRNIDGAEHLTIVEAKTRMRRCFGTIPSYERVQLEAYMHLYQCEHAVLVECVKGDTQIQHHTYTHDPEYFSDILKRIQDGIKLYL